MRLIVLILVIAALVAGILWLNNRGDEPMVNVDNIRAELPTVEMGTGSTTVTVPTDADIVTHEGEINGRSFEYPALDVETEERVIEYPTLEVTPAEPADQEAVEPVMRDPNDPVPPVDVEVQDDGSVTATQPAP